jgi:preprotein translocase subunit SecE
MSNSVQVKPALDFNLVKWLVVFALVVVGVYGNSHYANEYTAYERAVPLIFMTAIAVFVALQTVRGVAFARLVKESRTEIRRVVWPTRKEATQTTLVVVLLVLIMALILWGLDWGLNQLVSLIIG